MSHHERWSGKVTIVTGTGGGIDSAEPGLSKGMAVDGGAGVNF